MQGDRLLFVNLMLTMCRTFKPGRRNLHGFSETRTKYMDALPAPHALQPTVQAMVEGCRRGRC